MIRANIKVPRQDIKDLHDWLDRMTPGWLYWGSATAGTLDEETTRRCVVANNNFAAKMVKDGKGELWSTIAIVVPENRDAMAIKLTWLNAELLLDEDQACKATIGDRIALNG